MNIFNMQIFTVKIMLKSVIYNHSKFTVKIVKKFGFVKMSLFIIILNKVLCNTKYQAKTGTPLYVERTPLC